MISIIIPTYNEANRLPKTLSQIIKSFEKSSYFFEIIIVDDDSPDNTIKVSKNFLKKNHRNTDGMSIIYHNVGKKKGKGNAVKEGFKLAKGEIILFYDANGSIPAEYPVIQQY